MTTTQTPEPKKDRARTRLVADRGLVEFIDDKDNVTESYSLENLSDVVRSHLTVIGLRTILHGSKDRAVSYKALVDGELPGRSTPTHLRGTAAWKEAYAQFLVEKKSAASLEDARAAAEKLDAAGLRQIQKKPGVFVIHAKLTGVTDDDEPVAVAAAPEAPEPAQAESTAEAASEEVVF
jgi:hypothetical protein